MTMEKPFKLTLGVVWWMQIILILSALVFTVASVFVLASVFGGEMSSLFVLFLFVFFAYMGWANAFSTIQITDESVTVTVFYGRFRINWNEVLLIVQHNELIALMSNDKRLVLSLGFAGKNSEKMLEYFSQQIETRKIEFEKNSEPLPPFPITHHNARVWR